MALLTAGGLRWPAHQARDELPRSDDAVRRAAIEAARAYRDAWRLCHAPLFMGLVAPTDLTT